MRNYTNKEMINSFNRVLDDYGFICYDIRLGKNGIQRYYNDFACFEGMRLNIITNNKGALVSLYNLEELVYEDIMSIDVIKAYMEFGIRIELLVEVIISTIDDFLEGGLDE